MQSVSRTHGGPLEAEQVKHATTGGRHNISEKQSTQPLVDATPYRSIVGSLRYLVSTHPNIAFAVGYVSHFLKEPREDHLATMKKILRYVTGTCNWVLWFGRKKGNQTLLTGFSDADYAGDVDARKSTIGVIFFLANSLITWQSTKQKVVAQFSCESSIS
jgi:hypothetical protein